VRRLRSRNNVALSTSRRIWVPRQVIMTRLSDLEGGEESSPALPASPAAHPTDSGAQALPPEEYGRCNQHCGS